MDILNALRKEHSKTQTLRICKYIGKDKKRFGQLITVILSADSLMAQRASWVLGIHGEYHPDLIIPHLKKLLALLDKKVHPALKRNLLRVLQYMEIPKRFEASVATHCFELLQSSSEPPAIKAFSITILVNLSMKYPDLLQELKAWFLNNQQVASKAEIKRMELAGLLQRDCRK